jgi:esterase/lipase
MNKKEIESYFKINGGTCICKKTNKSCFLLLHGLAPKPGIFNELVDYIENEDGLNCDVFAPEQRFSENNILIKSSYKAWIKDASYYYNKLDSCYDNVYVVGHSLGGVVALDLAFKRDLKNVILLSAPVKINFKLLFSSSTKFLKIPFNLKWNIFLLVLENYKILSKVKSNILYCIGLKDKTISTGSAKKIIKCSKSSNYVHIEYIPNCSHLDILKNKKICDDIFNKILLFLDLN